MRTHKTRSPRLARLALAGAAAACTVMVGTAASHAQPAGNQQSKAEEYYNKGDAAYNLGRFDEAIENFTKAYEEWPLPEFLYNIAQSYRQQGNCKQALFFYKRFKSLKEKDKDNPLTQKQRDEVDGLPIVDPCQQWWDLLDLGGEDRAEAADRFRTAIVSRTLPRTR